MSIHNICFHIKTYIRVHRLLYNDYKIEIIGGEGGRVYVR